MGEACSTYERLNMRKPEGKRPFGRHARRWEDNIRPDLREIGCEGLDWMQWPVANSCEHGNKPSGSITYREFDYLRNY
jgi:hypothetical protein